LTKKAKSKSRRKVWNKGQLVGPKLPLTLKEVRAIRSSLNSAQQMRDLAMFNLAIDSALRACDLVALRVRDICKSGRVVSNVKIKQSAASRPVQFETSKETQESVGAWVAKENLKPRDHLFPSRINASPHISVRQYMRIVATWVSQAGLDPEIHGTESLRRTKPVLIYARTKNLEAVQLLSGHARLGNVVRFLGIEAQS
jgi:integrase